MINSLQSLRGIFAILIYLHHFAGFDAGGDSGVCFFIMLSGFVLCAGYQHRIELSQVSPRDFLNRRLSKIYPLHIVTLAAAIVLQSYMLSLPMVIIWLSNMFLVQSWVPVMKVYFSGSGVSWCLSSLVFCYLMFPVIIKTTNKFRNTKCLPYCISALLCMYFIIIQIIPDNLQNAIIYVNPLLRLFDFCIGILLWQLYDKIQRGDIYQRIAKMPKSRKTLVEVAVIVLFFVFTLCYPLVPARYGLASYWWVPVAILIATFSLFSEHRGSLSDFLNKSILIKFGNISFSFYMIHTLTYLYLEIILKKLGISPPLWVMLLASFMLITLLAYAINRWFEKPMSSFWLTKVSNNGLDCGNVGKSS